MKLNEIAGTHELINWIENNVIATSAQGPWPRDSIFINGAQVMLQSAHDDQAFITASTPKIPPYRISMAGSICFHKGPYANIVKAIPLNCVDLSFSAITNIDFAELVQLLEYADDLDAIAFYNCTFKSGILALLDLRERLPLTNFYIEISGSQDNTNKLNDICEQVLNHKINDEFEFQDALVSAGLERFA